MFWSLKMVRTRPFIFRTQTKRKLLTRTHMSDELGVELIFTGKLRISNLLDILYIIYIYKLFCLIHGICKFYPFLMKIENIYFQHRKSWIKTCFKTWQSRLRSRYNSALLLRIFERIFQIAIKSANFQTDVFYLCKFLENISDDGY